MSVLWISAFFTVIIALIFTVASLSTQKAGISTETSVYSSETTTENSTQSIGITNIETLVSCIAINNPSQFKNIQSADTTELMSIALWCVLESDCEKEYDFQSKQMVISESCVESMFYSLFTSSATVCHSTVNSECITFSYDEIKKVYYVPITGVTPKYTAQIIKQKQKGNTITIKADYIPQNDWVQDTNGNIIPPEKEKTAFITLKQKSNKTLTVCSVIY